MGSVTVGLCAVVSMLGLSSIFNIGATKDVEKAVKEIKPAAVEQHVTNNNYETHNHYESNDNNKEEIKKLEEKIAKLEEDKEEQETKEDEQVLVGVNQNGVVYQAQPTKEVWRGPKSYKCNMAAGYPAECGYCGEVGEIHFNIKEWQDEQGTYHLTHVGCGQRYCDKVGVQPRIEELYKIR